MRAFSCIPLRSPRRSPRWLVCLLGLLLRLACADAQANTYTVTNLSDSGAGSLRQAITDANANPGADSIVFMNGLTGTITIVTALPNLTDEVTLTGPGAKLLTIARSGTPYSTPFFRILTIDAGTATPPTVSIFGLTLANGFLSVLRGGGGAVYSNKANVTFTDCVMTNNGVRSGLTFGLGGTPNAGALGGGVYNDQGTMTLTRCTVNNNGAGVTPFGGGLYNGGGTMSLANCTISGNRAIGSASPYPTVVYGYGGGIWNSGTLNLAGCTFANNTAQGFLFDDVTGGYYYPGYGSSVYNAGTSSTTHVTLYQSILVNGGSKGGSNVVSASGIVLNSLGYNLSNDATGPNDDATDRLNVDAKLSPLADYGGPTPTCMLLSGSPALDAGDPNFINNPPATDQRGQPRVANGRVDIGAVERQAVELIAVNDAFSVKHDHTLRVAAPGVLANDTGVAPLSAVLVAQPANGTLLLNADGSFVYTPNAGYGVSTNGASDSFTYAAQDGSGKTSNVATVTITIIPDNAPTLTNSLSGTATPGQAWSFTATATDADLPDDTLTFALVNAPSGMTINGATGAIAWTPQTEGVFTFDIKVTDHYGKSDQKTFTLTVFDNPPALTNSLSATVTAGQAWSFTATATDADLPNDALTFSLVNPPSGMSINGATGAIAWTPKVAGVVTFGIKVTDRYGKSDQKTFTLTVQSDPSAPVSLSITNVVVGRVNANTVTVSFIVVNSGTGRATNLVIARATLGPWLSVANSPPVTVEAGNKQAYTLTFSGVASSPKVVYPLQIHGTYQAQNAAQSLFYGGGVLVP